MGLGREVIGDSDFLIAKTSDDGNKHDLFALINLHTELCILLNPLMSVKYNAKHAAIFASS